MESKRFNRTGAVMEAQNAILPDGHILEVLFSDETAGNYYSVQEAEDAIEMAVTGNAMGPHGSPATPVSMVEVDSNRNPVRKLHLRAKVQIVDYNR